MYHHAMTHPHSNIILSLFSIPLVLKYVTKILKIGLQIKNFLNRDFRMEKLLPSHYFPRKNKSLNILLKMQKTNTK